ncbi:MAG: Coenzyme F420 hydrogenase/dehydrogenase, beta subunit C-terminal domain [Bacteroidales bacterium]|nr:Coenzyme F420 hydrogenase/dehydrogenase, beta subunit C-terminal domain [Bacteroidales bacterium]
MRNKSNCTGCAACHSICSVNCVSMQKDAEGFLYPFIDKERCNKCEICEKKCPAIIQGSEKKPIKVYAAKNPDEEIRNLSSSGGIFTLLAEYTISNAGVVFGAKFNEAWEVVHDYTETTEGLAAFRGSKYVQSDIGNAYKTAKDFLSVGRKVLFSGAPCQIAGLKAFLQKNYDNLMTVDFVCHGVPSPLVWKKYLNELVGDIRHISDIRFRDKNTGWKSYNSVVCLLSNLDGNESQFIESFNVNTYMKGFLCDLYLRPSCHNCPTKSLKSGSDVTIADYWGIQNVLPKFDDDKGVSLVMVNTEKGKLVYDFLDKDDRETTYAEALVGNPIIESSVSIPAKRAVFFEKWQSEPVISLINKLTADISTMKIGVLNMQYSNHNYGAVLVAAALEYVLKQQGYNSEHINFIMHRTIIKKIKILRAICGIRKYEVHEDDSKRGIFERFRKKWLTRTQKKIYHSEQLFHEISDYDAIIVGSDQVWRTSFLGKHIGTFFLDFAKNNTKKISYAASFGLDNWELDRNDDRTLMAKTLLKQFKAISVREDSGVEICKNVFDVNAECVLDPVLLAGRTFFDKIIKKGRKRYKMKEDYIVRYKLNDIQKAQFLNSCDIIADSLALPVKDIYHKTIRFNKFSKKVYPKVSRLLFDVQNSSFVITDSFHIMCLAILFNKQFVVWNVEVSGLARLQSLLKKLDLLNRIIDDTSNPETLRKTFSSKIDFAKINDTLEKMRQTSLLFLIRALT